MKDYKSISDLLSSSQSERTPVSEDFDVFYFRELHKVTKKMMPPHQRKFYTIIFIQDQKEGNLSINQARHSGLNNTLLFQGKDHVFSFVRDENIEGGIIMFHQSFLLPFIKNIESDFPYFNILNHNYFHLNNSEQVLFENLFESIIAERFSISVAKPMLWAFLEKSKLLYNTYEKEEQFLSKKSLIIRRYKNLISNNFIENKEVSFYAQKLNITPNYLNEVVKSETGRSAKKHITERVLLEAKNLLLYSGMDISEVSHILQFSEPTHFSKFFKKETGQTPRVFQKKQQP